jgi:molybdopterin-guanine dinucleotide biosynthesis protein B/molybdopterin-guanine dinucleotide biosynthesis protein
VIKDEYGSSVDVGVLIAGGTSRRAGVDKRYLVLGGRTLLVRNVAFLRTLFPRVAVVVARGQTPDLGDAEGVDVLHDAWPSRSPLVGIATALAHYRRSVFVLAVDIPFPRRETATSILEAFRGRDAALLTGESDRRQPLFAAYGPRCLPPMVRLLESGHHRVIDAFSHISVAELPSLDDAHLGNINTMDDYESARRVAREEEAGARLTRPALVAIVGKSDSGKTTLIEKLVPELVELGLRVGTVKHDAHSFEIDHPGKDSWRHGQAGAEAYVIASPERLAYIARLDEELELVDIVRRFYGGFDIVVAEGYKRTAPHRVELFRAGAGHAEPLCAPGEAIALVTDADLEHEHRFGLEDGAGLARFLAARLDALRDY